MSALTSAQQTFADQQAPARPSLTAERAAAQAPSCAARPNGRHPTTGQSTRCTAGGPVVRNWDRVRRTGRPRLPAKWDQSLWDPTLPAIPSAFVSGDPIAIINTVLGIVGHLGAGHRRTWVATSCSKLGILPTPTGYHQRRAFRASTAGRPPSTSSGAPCRRWACRTPGAAATPPARARGIDSGAGTVGFDCSGLILYAFAGVGIKLPHYSGSQYDMGRKIPSSQMRRGDVIFYGPGGSQHVTLYLGNGQMLEAPVHGFRRSRSRRCAPAA